MKVILELNDFQRIIDIDKPTPSIEVYYAEPGEVFSIQGIPEDLAKRCSMKRISFNFEGEIGNFLLYKYSG